MEKQKDPKQSKTWWTVVIHRHTCWASVLFFSSDLFSSSQCLPLLVTLASRSSSVVPGAVASRLVPPFSLSIREAYWFWNPLKVMTDWEGFLLEAGRRNKLELNRSDLAEWMLASCGRMSKIQKIQTFSETFLYLCTFLSIVKYKKIFFLVKY